MDECKNNSENFSLPKEVSAICERLKTLFDIEKLIIFGIKRSEKQNIVTDVDICVITNEQIDKNIMLKKAYIEIDSDIPFDLFIYTAEEWADRIQHSKSFASRIVRKGCVVYERE